MDYFRWKFMNIYVHVSCELHLPRTNLGYECIGLLVTTTSLIHSC